MGIQGTGLKDPNIRLRYLLIFFGGIIAFGAVFYWRQQTIQQAEYVDMTIPKSAASKGELRSKNYQIEVEDVSPTAR